MGLFVEREIAKLPCTKVDTTRFGPQVTCADQKESLAPKINCVHFNKQPFRLGTGGDWGFRGGDRGLGT